MDKLIYAPWDAKILGNLRRRQEDRSLHPYTCPKCSSVLTPRRKGWKCTEHGYVQDWALIQDVINLKEAGDE